MFSLMKYIFFFIFISINLSISSQNEIKNGLYRIYHDNGQLKTIGKYEGGKKVGVWKDYYQTGELKSTYSYTKGKYNPESKSYFKNGNIEIERTFVHGKKIFKEYYESGELLFESIINGGYAKEYFKNGNLKSLGNYVNQELVGTWKRYYESGELEWEVEYLDSYKQGIYKHYYKTGQVKIEGQTKRNKKYGVERRYYKEGLMKWEGKYLNGVFHGKWKGFDKNGNQIHLINYKKGVASTKALVELSLTEIPLGRHEEIPVFPGCDNVLGFKNQRKCLSDKMNKHVTENFNTEIAEKIGLKGKQRVVAIFKIDKEGNITGKKSKAPHPLLEKEVIRVISLLPKMKSGYRMGKPVVVPYSLPIVFIVQGNTKK
ncbi:hypothetical protein EYD46_11415 [Hyunsoonleella pacifica]|uniref:TonB C-terminal domain-containing protein n=2 Tax=Hyunsoonleella pacifica TaxID=1080224 RepID=A0A4Q9FP06_9FLAO|nr:hypothetical protein EYD46_11415 [Hyunsoonleella pacifica]